MDRPCRQSVIALALPAPQDVRPVGKTIWLASITAPLADKTVRPANRLKISGASSIIREQMLKFRQRAGEWQVIAGERD
jgi:hypothetical protein